MLVDQLILYAWLIFSGVFDLAQHLPFYSCRLAIWLLLLGRFCGYKWAKKIGVWWGLFGSISALLVPDMYGYAFPHYTNFNFYIAHLGLGFLAIYEVFVNAYDFPRRDMRDISLALNLFCLITILVNSCLHAAGVSQANYAYLAAPPPPLVSLFHNWPKFAYMAFAVLAYNLMTVLEWILGRFCLYSLVRLRDKGKEKGI